MVFDSVSANIDQALSINPSANAFVFGDFNVHHKDWLTYPGGTDRSGKLCYIFSPTTLLKFPTQILVFYSVSDFPTQIPDCDSDSPALFDLFLSSYASISSTMALPPLGNSHHVVVPGSIDFPSIHNWMPHFIA